jgi:HSP20 family protein
MDEKNRFGNEIVQFQPVDDEQWMSPADHDQYLRIQRNSRLWRPPTDVFETDHGYVVLVEISGMAGSEFAVTFANRILTVRGSRRDLAEHKAYHQMEIAYGEFESQVRVPAEVDSTNIEASYKDGFLRVALPKSES